MRTVSLKIDVCTREGMLRGVPTLLATLARHRAQASFILAFGPDCSGRAITRLLQPRFRRKMARTSALKLYGLRTLLSGTLLRARPVASDAPALVRRIRDEGHEVAFHGWNHRRWQDRLDQLELAADAYVRLLGEPPRASGAPGWRVTPRSLRVQERFGFEYASDLRGGPPCRLEIDASRLPTLQLPTSGPVVEELLAEGIADPDAMEQAILRSVRGVECAVIGLHAEIEGRSFQGLLERLLGRLRDEFDAMVPLRVAARAVSRQQVAVRRLVSIELAGRADRVASSAPLPMERACQEERA